MSINVSKKTFYISVGAVLAIVIILLIYFFSQQRPLRCDTFQDRYPGITCGLFTISPDKTLYQFVGVLRESKVKNNEGYLTVEMSDKKGQKVVETFVLPSEPYKVYWKKLSKAKVELKDHKTITHGSVVDITTPYTASDLARQIRPNTEIILSVVDIPENKLPELKMKFGNLKMFQCTSYVRRLAQDLSNPAPETNLVRFVYKTKTGCSAYAQLITTF